MDKLVKAVIADLIGQYGDAVFGDTVTVHNAVVYCTALTNEQADFICDYFSVARM